MDAGTINSLASRLQSTANASSQTTQAQASTPVASTVSAAAVQTANAVPQAATPPSMEQLKQAVSEINKVMQAKARGLEFTVDVDDKRQIITRIVDKQTNEVILQIPSEETLAIAKALEQTSGQLIKQTA